MNPAPAKQRFSISWRRWTNPIGGTVILDGKNLKDVKESAIASFRRDNLGFVFQDFNLLDTFSLEDNIYLPLVLAGKSYKEIRDRLTPIATGLGISDILKKYPYEVSGGQKQRAAVARAMITNPKLILADEPTGALDSRSTDELLRLFAEVNRTGQTINAVMGTNETLNEGEALLYSYRTGYDSDTISFNNAESFKIKKQIYSFTGSGTMAINMLSSIMPVVPDLENSLQGIEDAANVNGDIVAERWIFNFDTGMEPEEQVALYHSLTDTLTDPLFKEKFGYTSVYTRSQEFERGDFYGLFGSLFYLGVIFSLVFILAAVLIIYYKQISEGYEDQARFDIMQKVGMTKREIRKSINSQLLTVFFLPLVLAAVHMCFAFPIVRKILLAFNLNNVLLFAATTAISVLTFAVFYTIVYTGSPPTPTINSSAAREGTYDESRRLHRR